MAFTLLQPLNQLDLFNVRDRKNVNETFPVTKPY